MALAPERTLWLDIASSTKSPSLATLAESGLSSKHLSNEDEDTPYTVCCQDRIGVQPRICATNKGQQQPAWRLSFAPRTTAAIWNPVETAFTAFGILISPLPDARMKAGGRLLSVDPPSRKESALGCVISFYAVPSVILINVTFRRSSAPSYGLLHSLQKTQVMAEEAMQGDDDSGRLCTVV